VINSKSMGVTVTDLTESRNESNTKRKGPRR
jgi:hypothetical protein